MNTEVVRDALLHRLQAGQHVSLCAPSGYGKTRLLRQYACPERRYLVAQPGSTLSQLISAAQPGAITLMDLRAAGVQALLIDDFHLLSAGDAAEVLGALMTSPVQVILAMYHTGYPHIQQLLAKDRLILLSSAALAFTPEEAAAYPSAPQALGWPSVTALSATAHFSLPDYLDDLIAQLPRSVQDQLSRVTDAAAADATLLDWEVSGQRAALLDTGFPLIDVGGRFALHPLITERLRQRPKAPASPTSSTFALYLRLAQQATDSAHKTRILETYFNLYGETDVSPGPSIEMLRTVPVEQLTPGLRDRLADLLVTTQQMDEAETVLAYQRATNQASSLTFAALARMANYANDIPALKAFSEQALRMATTKVEESRALGMLSLALTRTERGDYHEALALATRRYHVALESESLREELSSHWTMINAYQLLGQVEAGISSARRARTRGKDQRQLAAVTIPILNELADMLKGVGEYREALEVIQEALALNEEMPTTSVPYTLFTRGLIYLEMRRDDDAHAAFRQSIEAFRDARIAAGLLMPYSFLAFLQWRQGWFEEIEGTFEEMRRLVAQISLREDYVEWLAYVPLVDGVYHLGRREPELALTALRQVMVQGHEVYDSVLLTLLLICAVELEVHGTVPEADAERLAALLAAVPDSNVVTLRAYAPDFLPALQTMMTMGYLTPEMANHVFQAPDLMPLKPSYHVRITTMGTPGIAINGEVMHVENLYPVYTLAYLALQPGLPDGSRRYVTSSMLASDLYGGVRGAAQSSVSFLRRALTRRDPELAGELLSAKNDRSGYRVNVAPHLLVSLDVEVYLSREFSPSNPDMDELWRLMRGFQPFFPTRSLSTDSPFVEDLNTTLLARFKTVALHVMETELLMNRPKTAILALLTYLRHDQDYDVLEQLTQLMATHTDYAPELAYLMDCVRRDDDHDFAELVRSAIVALA